MLILAQKRVNFSIGKISLAGVWLSEKVDNHGIGIYDTGKLMVPGIEAIGTSPFVG